MIKKGSNWTEAQKLSSKVQGKASLWSHRAVSHPVVDHSVTSYYSIAPSYGTVVAQRAGGGGGHQCLHASPWPRRLAW